MPVIPGRVLDAPQTVQAEGTRITLRWAVVTPSETRLVLHVIPAPSTDGGVEREWEPIAKLQVSDAAPDVQRLTPEAGHFGGGGQQQGEDYDYRIPYPLYDCRGEWTLPVSELVGFGRNGGQVRLSGPWVLRFAVP